MQTLSRIDLSSDSTASAYVKDEIVDVVFAADAGQILSREGPNHFLVGDALITGSTGDRWSVSRDRFDAKYVALAPTAAGQDGQYRARAVPVLAKQMSSAFSIARREGGDLLKGMANDWVLQYGPGDYGLVEDARFQRVYRRVAD